MSVPGEYGELLCTVTLVTHPEDDRLLRDESKKKRGWELDVVTYGGDTERAHQASRRGGLCVRPIRQPAHAQRTNARPRGLRWPAGTPLTTFGECRHTGGRVVREDTHLAHRNPGAAAQRPRGPTPAHRAARTAA